MNKIKVALVDDHQIVRDGIKSLLSNQEDIQIVGEAKDAYEFLELVKSKLPDIVLLDISLPKMNGIELTKVIRADYPKIKILILSMYTSEDFIFNALKAGIHGYLPKNTTQDELRLAINDVYAGKEYFSKTISDTILKSYMHSAKYGNTVTDDKLIHLTNREREILQYVVEGATNLQIAEKLCISIRTVETHKTTILKKLNLNNVIDLVKFAIKNNLIDL